MGALINSAELAELRDSHPDTVVLDVRWRLAGPPGHDDYLLGHLPGAVFVDLDRELAAEPGAAGRHPLPGPVQLQATLRAAGITADSPVVVYDDADGSVAARAWWLLRWAGHDRVTVLDGGYAGWIADGGVPSTEVPVPQPGDVTVVPGSVPVLDADEAAELASTGLLLDARAPQRYSGEQEPIDPRAGHVPGAVNAPFAAHTADGRWRTAEDLRGHFGALGVTGDRRIGAYCGSGVTACSVLLALEVAGLSTPERPAALYAGSWSHWSGEPERPIATGSTPG
ncbi:sulfurtransferase [Pseudonocardiaceae bacterium YIM PH 21723]|nr:sulfurtransferase [Pseudonocardiaceae bacterium YIM PH 21723]